MKLMEREVKELQINYQEVSVDTSWSQDLPKHLLKLVFLSIKTLLDNTFPKGLKIEANSESPYSTEESRQESRQEKTRIRETKERKQSLDRLHDWDDMK